MAFESMCGIYEIVNLVDGKRYIGSSVNLVRRQRVHFRDLDRGKHHNFRLQKAWTKYGKEAFVFQVLEYCDTAEVLIKEQEAMLRRKPKYNVSPTAGSLLGFRFNEESCAARRGRKRSPESVAGTAAAHKGMKRTAETKAKIARQALGRKRTVESVEAGANKLRGKKLPPERVQHLIGNSHAKGHVHTEAWKKANSLLHTGRKRPKSPEYRAKISAALKGIPHSMERRVKQAAAQTGIKRGPYRRQNRCQL